MDEAVLPEAPKLLQSLAIDHARDGEERADRVGC
jgi:hypothetical protein